MSDPKTEKLFRKAISAVKARKGRSLVFGARTPITPGMRVASGHGPDRDTGIVESVDGPVSRVRWDSGATTPADTKDLRPTKERSSGGHTFGASLTIPQRMAAIGVDAKRIPLGIGRNGYAYYADESGEWYWISEKDAKYATTCAKKYDIPDAYGHWCAGTISKPVPEKILREHGLIR